MFKARLILMFLLAVIIMAPVQAKMLDNMDTIYDANDNGEVWADDREPGEGGIGLLQQGTDPCDGSNGVMMLDYGNTTDPCGVSDPCSGYDYLGNWVGVGAAGGAFRAVADPNDPNGTYVGKLDRVPSAPFPPGDIPCLTYPSNYYFTLDVYKPLTGYAVHARSLQLYDTTTARSTYHIQREGGADLASLGGPGRTIMDTPTGWTRFIIPITAANIDEEDNADLCDIVTVKIWVSSWACYSTATTNPYDVYTEPNEYVAWPEWGQGDWTLTPRTGLPLLIDNLQLFEICDRIIEGDINHDCEVDLLDFAIVADDWLETD